MTVDLDLYLLIQKIRRRKPPAAWYARQLILVQREEEEEEDKRGYKNPEVPVEKRGMTLC